MAIPRHLRWKVVLAMLMATAPVLAGASDQATAAGLGMEASLDDIVAAEDGELFHHDDQAYEESDERGLSYELGDYPGAINHFIAAHVAQLNNAAASVHTVPPSDTYIEGYLQGLLDGHYPEDKVRVSVVDRKITLTHLPTDPLHADSIVSFISNAPGVIPLTDPQIEGTSTELKMEKPTARRRLQRQNGVWFPDADRLFSPLIADPRQPQTGLGWRYNDQVLGRNVGEVFIGEEIPVFRWLDVPKWHGQMQIGLEGGIWSVFDMDVQSAVELLNTDFKIGIILTYAKAATSYRLSLNHISSHLGDEYIVEHPGVVRLNPSQETLEFAASHYFIPPLRLYGSLGYVIKSDRSFPMDHWFVDYGLELRVFGYRDLYNRLVYQPFFACNISNWERWDWRFEQTYQLGLEVGKLDGNGRKVRLYVDYYSGNSDEGQFATEYTNFLSVRFSYGF